MNKKIYRIILIILLIIAPMIVNAEDVFEHDKINDNVFLKGKYLQLGINGDTGVFGTIPIEYDSSNEATLKKYATTELKSGESLGMRYNEYGWDSDKAPKTGDFTVNANKINQTNSSKDTLSFIYCYGDCKNNSVYSLRGDGYKDYDENTGAGIKITSITDASDPTNKVLKAVVDGQIKILGKDNKLTNVMVFKITYSFKNDSKYIHTLVEVTNNGIVQLNNLKVMRLMNPDQDKLINRTSLTYNKVITKAKSNLKDPGYSMIVSRGETTLDGMFYLSFAGDSYPAMNEKYYTVNNTTEAPKDVITSSMVSCTNVIKGTDLEKDIILNKVCNFMPSYPKLPNTASSDSLSIFYQGNEENGHTLSDTSISMLTVAGNVAVNGKATVAYYTSLDNNVITGLAEVLAEHNADIISRTDTTIKIKTQSNRHYAIVECPIVDGETDFENCNLPDEPDTFDGVNNELTFEHLKPSTFYKIYYKIGDGKFEENALITKTKASPKKAVEIHPVVVTEDSITIKGEHGYEYSKDNGEHWQKGETFDGLNPNTEYTFVGRSEETFYDMPGEKSEAIKVKTLPKVSDAYDGVDARIEVKIVDAVPTIKFSKALLYDAIKDDGDLKAAILDGHKKVQIVFDVIKLYPNDEELQDLKPYMKRKKLAYGFDVEIKLYVNGEHIKDISELSKKIDLEVSIPEQYKEKDKKFFVIRKHIISMSEPALYEILDDLDSSDDTISIKNDLFSEFYVTFESDEEDIVNPKTGVHSLILLVFVSIIGIVFVYRESKNKSLFKLI